MLPRPATSTDHRLHNSALRTSRSAIDGPSGDVDQFVDLSQYSEDQRRVWQSHFRALIAYRPPQFPIHVTLFRSPVHLLRSSFDSRYGWADVALAGVTVKTIPGAHEAIMEEPLVARLASEIGRSLNDARRSAL
jgi:thioesterase domain-containing protein